jgi:VIT1/CCC1 family predicted Fe2+/Mn2+ transporter
MSTSGLDKLIWALIYGGLLAVCLGFFMKDGNAGLGWGAVVIGALLAITGAVLIYVRSKRP